MTTPPSVLVEQQAVTTESTVRKAVVFSGNRAQVTRECTVALSPGDHTVHVEGTWTAVNRDSLQVAIRQGVNECALRGVQFKSIESVEDVRPRIAELDAQLKEVRSKKKLLAEDEALARTGYASYEAVRRKLVSVTAKVDGAAVPTAYDTQQWKATTTMLMKGMQQYTEQLRKLSRELRALDKQADELAGRRTKLSSSGVRRTQREVAELLVSVAGDDALAKPVSLGFELSYLVEGAKWEPKYDLRIDSKARTMALGYNATVTNRTGEDWRQVELVLSTVPATLTASLPPLPKWELSTTPPATTLGCLSLDECEGAVPFSAAAAPMQQMMTTNMIPSRAPPAPRRAAAYAPATTASAAVKSAAGGSSTFSVAAPTTVLTTGDAVKTPITTLTLPVHFRYSTVPKLDGRVYLKVKALNTSEFDLLAGKATVFSDNQLVSNTRLDPVAPGEDFWTFIGPDSDITVKRVPRKHHTSTTKGGLLTAKKDISKHEFGYVVQNFKGREEELVVWDQYPVATDSRISVTSLSPSEMLKPEEAGHTACMTYPLGAPGAHVDPAKGTKGQLLTKVNEQKFIEWFVQAGPKQQVHFEFGFTVEHSPEFAVDV